MLLRLMTCRRLSQTQLRALSRAASQKVSPAVNRRANTGSVSTATLKHHEGLELDTSTRTLTHHEWKLRRTLVFMHLSGASRAAALGEPQRAERPGDHNNRAATVRQAMAKKEETIFTDGPIHRMKKAELTARLKEYTWVDARWCVDELRDRLRKEEKKADFEKLGGKEPCPKGLASMKKSELISLLDTLRVAYQYHDTRPRLIEKVRAHYDQQEESTAETVHRIGEWAGMTYGELEKKDHYTDWVVREVESCHRDDPPSWQLMKFYNFVKRDKSKDPKPTTTTPKAGSASSSGQTAPVRRRSQRRGRGKGEDDMSAEETAQDTGADSQHQYLVKALSTIMERLDRVELMAKKEEPKTKVEPTPKKADDGESSSWSDAGGNK